MAYNTIMMEEKGGIATITMNRPENLNALTPEMRVEIRKALENAGADDEIRVVILTGAGRGFCAGAEFQTIINDTEKAEDEPKLARLMKPVQTPRVLEVIRNLTKPTICALNGVAAGAGMALALICDLIIASDQSRFRLAFGRMGAPIVDGMSSLLSRRIGTHRTLELFYTNEIIDAKEMERMGLVNKVVPHEQLMDVARETAKKMFQIPPITLALGKRCVYKGVVVSDLEEHEQFETLAFKTAMGTEDAKEAQKSYLERREPKYKGQ